MLYLIADSLFFKQNMMEIFLPNEKKLEKAEAIKNFEFDEQARTS